MRRRVETDESGTSNWESLNSPCQGKPFSGLDEGYLA